MSINKFINKKINSLLNITILLSIISGCIFAGSMFNIMSSLESPKNANAAAPNTANLIIGSSTVGTSIELSVCVQATDGPIHVGNTSLWFSFDETTLAPSSTILEKGPYTRTTGVANGYGNLVWYAVSGNSNIYTLSLPFDKNFGDGVQMSTSKEFFAKVKFDKIAGSNGSTVITPVSGRTQMFSTESPSVPVVFTTTNVVGDCRGAVAAVSSSTVSSVSSSTAQSYTIGVPVATTNNPVVGLVGGLPPVIALTGNTSPSGTVATVTIPGSTIPITGTIVNGNFVPNPGQTLPSTVTTGPTNSTLTIGSTTVSIPTNISNPPASTTIGTVTNTTTYPVVGAVDSNFPTITITGGNIPSGTPATFTPAGTTTVITGTIIGGNFVPNPGQTLPVGVTVGPATGVISIGLIAINVPTNFSSKPNTSGGGVIVICSGTCPVAQTNTTANTSNNTPAQATNPQATSTPNPVASKGTFKSKIKITDPYVCGEGAYGNVSDAKANGVDFVYYEFYKDGATTSSYNYKLKMNDKGDFYLPISKKTNLIEDGNYKIVFYALDNEGNKAQGDYTAQIASDCTKAKVNGMATNSATVRSGGINIGSLLVFILSLSLSYFLYQKSKSKVLKLKI